MFRHYQLHIVLVLGVASYLTAFSHPMAGDDGACQNSMEPQSTATPQTREALRAEILQLEEQLSAVLPDRTPGDFGELAQRLIQLRLTCMEIETQQFDRLIETTRETLNETKKLRDNDEAGITTAMFRIKSLQATILAPIAYVEAHVEHTEQRLNMLTHRLGFLLTDLSSGSSPAEQERQSLLTQQNHLKQHFRRLTELRDDLNQEYARRECQLGPGAL